MLSVNDSKVKDRKLILWARFHPDFARHILIPEIEANSEKYHAEPQSVERFRNCRYAENSLYFHHNYAYAEIPAGQEYEAVMRITRGTIEQDSIIRCKTTVLCFFSNFKTQPIPYAWHGHHAICLIQFHNGIPDMIQELYEIADKKTININREICLCSYDTLGAGINE